MALGDRGKRKGLGSRPLDTGEFMTGNLLMKGLDILGTPNYLAAGAADALLSGGNPVEGAVEGLRERMSFVDVLENRDVPKPIALPAGLVGDFLVPTVPILGWMRGPQKVAAAKRALTAADAILDGRRTIDDIARTALDTPKQLGNVVSDAGPGLLTRARAGAAAREAFRTADPEVATQAARHAAGEVLHGPTPPSTSRLIAQLIENGPQSATMVPQWLKATNEVGERLVRAFRSRLQENPMFRGVGGKYAELLDKRLEFKRQLLPELIGKVKDVTKDIKKVDHDRLFKMLNGFDDGAGRPDLVEKKEQIRALLDMMHRKMDDLNVHMTMGPETIIWKRLQQDGQGIALRYLKEARRDMAANGGQLSTDAIAMLSATEEGRFIRHILTNGMAVDDATGRIVGKLRYNRNYAPIMMKPHETTAFIGGDLENMSQALRAVDPNLLPESSRELAKRILADQAREPGDIRMSLQHARSGRVIVDDANIHKFVTDPEAYLTKYMHDSSDLVANAEVFGGRNEKFHMLRDELAQRHGYGSSSSIVGEPSPEYAAALSELDRSFEIANGSSFDPAASLVRNMNRISDTMFLGPRTILIQMTTFMNQAATQGLRNAMMGMVDMVTNPKLRQATRRTSALVPTMLDMVDEQGVLSKVSKWNFILKGVGTADRGMRMGAAIGAATALAEQETNILKLVQQGNMMKAEKMAGYVKRFFGVDPAPLLRGERLADDVLWAGAANNANLTNFTSDLLTLPKAYQSTAGKFFLKFKQYGMQQGMFINKIVEEGYKHGNWGPTLRYAATMPWIYSHVLRAVQQFRDETRQVDPDSDPKRYLQDLLLLGGFGYLGDAAQAFGSPSEGMKLGFIAGPNAGALAKITKAAIYAIPGEGQDLEKSADSITPQAGRQLRNLWSNMAD